MLRLSVAGLRARLLSLVVLAVIPAVALMLYTAWKQQRLASSEVQETTLRLVRLISTEYERSVEAARHLLIATARLPAVRNPDLEACSEFFADILKQYPLYANFGVIALDGDTFCSGLPMREPLNLADRSYFQRAVETGTFAIGDYQIGRITHKASVNFGYPVLNGSEKVEAVVFAALDLSWFNELAGKIRLPDGSALTVLDHKGTTLARYPNNGEQIGAPAPEAALIRTITSEQSEGTLEASVEGDPVLFAFNRLGAPTKTGTLYVGISIPEKTAFAPTRQVFMRSTLLLAFVGLCALLAAWVGGHLFILRPTNTLMAAAERVRGGDLSTRTGLPHEKSEFGRLARSFDEMAETLEARQLEAKRSREKIQQNLDRIRALHEIDLAIVSSLDLPVVLEFLLDKFGLFLPSASASTVRLLNRDTGQLEPVACKNLNELVWKAEEWKSGRGITNVVAETRAPLVVENIRKDPRARDREFFHRYNLVSYIGVPLIVKKELLGVLSAYTREEHRFSTEEIDFFSTLASQAAIAIHNSQLYKASEKQKAELASANSELVRREAVQRLLKELSQDTAAMDANRLAEKAAESMRRFLNADILDIRIADDYKRTVFSVSGVDPQRIRPIGGRARWHWLVENRRPLSIADISQEPDFPADPRSIKALGVRGYLAAPIISPAGEVIGVLRALTYQPRQFTKEDEDMLQDLANGFPLVLEQFRLLEQIKKQTAELEESNIQLQRSNQVKDEFLSVMSHELRTPLNVIVGYVEMLRDKMLGEINEKQETALTKIVARSSDLLSMITDILNVTRIEANEITLENYEISLKSFLDDLKSLYELPLDKGLALTWDYPSELPVIKTDSGKLKQVLQNLINNAIKFTAKGRVTVSVRHLAEANGVEFKVTDTGTGIAGEKIPAIFEMFRQADSSETRHYGGVGLGLYIVKKFTELLGGKIEVKSMPGKGSAFTVTIPVSQRTGAIR